MGGLPAASSVPSVGSLAPATSSASASATNGPAHKLFIGGLSWESDEDSLRDYFGRYGAVSDCVIMRDRHSGHPRGFGFVSYADEADADRVAAARHDLDGRTVEAKRAVPRSECTPAARTHMRATKKVFVGGLPSACGDREFFDYFARFGDIAESQVMYDHQTSNSRGFGFVTFAAEATVDRVVNMDHDICGKFIEVKRAEPKQVLEARRNGSTLSASSTPSNNVSTNGNSNSNSSSITINIPPPLPQSLPNTAPFATLSPTSASSVSLSLSALSIASAAAGGSPAAAAVSASSLFPPYAASSSGAWPSPPEPPASVAAAAQGQAQNQAHCQAQNQAHCQAQNQAHCQAQNQAHCQALNQQQPIDLVSTPLLLPPQEDGTSPAMSGMGFFAPASTYAPELAQYVHGAFYGGAFPLDAASFGTSHPVQSARADRRIHPYTVGRDRVERSYR
jgi:RNA recognition motif-containing protein